jgi:hypothetical protein
MALSNAHEIGDGFYYFREQDMYLFESLFIRALHVGYDLDRLRERLVAFGETIQPFIDVHLLIVYPCGDISQRAAGGAGLANFAASIGTFG